MKKNISLSKAIYMSIAMYIMYNNVYVHIYICKKCVYIHVYIYAYICICRYIYMYMYINVYVYIYAFPCVYSKAGYVQKLHQ